MRVPYRSFRTVFMLIRIPPTATGYRCKKKTKLKKKNTGWYSRDASAHGGISVRSRTLTLAVSNAAPKAACSPMSQFPRALIILLLSFCPLALSSCGVCKCEFVLCRTAFCPNRVCVRIFFSTVERLSWVEYFSYLTRRPLSR